ncbi:MAG: DinB family protein [Anaerolineales bacterium]|nr:DinB family protein [Anaerolineales bacterium]
MQTSDEVNRILALLADGPLRLEKAARGVQTSRLNQQTETEPWSVSDILSHLRACSDSWGNSIRAMLTQENPTQRYVSPRSWMKKPKYREETFAMALALFTEERQKLLETLQELDEADWARPGTFTGTSARQRNQTVFSFARRMVNHEQPHLEQIEALLR